MFKNDSGKLLVYASSSSLANQRLNFVKDAAEKMAQQLNLKFEMVEQVKGIKQTYVYYENGNEDPVPLYCDEGKTDDLQEIYEKLKNMMFVLSFHPKHTALKQARINIMRSA
jgi:uncharacterized protein YlbG (UPF0298 family)